ncbi:Cytochrome C Oxidase Subunit 8C [Manis pentadactyla]|nr:Cytochrome C Oxidase Subunit 8C [Manis pentadactyla]
MKPHPHPAHLASPRQQTHSSVESCISISEMFRSGQMGLSEWRRHGDKCRRFLVSLAAPCSRAADICPELEVASLGTWSPHCQKSSQLTAHSRCCILRC